MEFWAGADGEGGAGMMLGLFGIKVLGIAGLVRRGP
jgi:hypothetical protein